MTHAIGHGRGGDAWLWRARAQLHVLCVWPQSESRDKALQALVDRAGHEHQGGIDSDQVVRVRLGRIKHSGDKSSNNLAALNHVNMQIVEEGGEGEDEHRVSAK